MQGLECQIGQPGTERVLTTSALFLFSFEADVSSGLLQENKDKGCYPTSVALTSLFQFCTELCQLQHRTQNSDNLFLSLLESIMNFITLKPAIPIICLLINQLDQLETLHEERLKFSLCIQQYDGHFSALFCHLFYDQDLTSMKDYLLKLRLDMSKATKIKFFKTVVRR